MKQYLILIILLFFLFCGCDKTKDTTKMSSFNQQENEGILDSELSESRNNDENESCDISPVESSEVDSTKMNQVDLDQNKEYYIRKEICYDSDKELLTDNNAKKSFCATQPVTEDTFVAIDCKAVAEKLIEFLNQYRCNQGVVKAQVSEELIPYDEYRSRQLVSNFAHNTLDERAAATALKYGTYVDPAVYGMDGEPYYTAQTAEAIAMAGYVGTETEIAEKFAQLIRGSPEHWSYVGNAKYSKIAVGITYEGNLWYVDVAMKTE